MARCTLCTLLAGFANAGYIDTPEDFAVSVVSYTPGAGVGSDFLSGEPFNDPSTALGRPTVDTTGDGFGTGIGADEFIPAVPVYPPFRAFEIVTIGVGGELIVELGRPVRDDPRHPFGVDFIVFGNAFLVGVGGGSWANGDPASYPLSGTVFAEPGTVAVSPGYRGLPGEIEEDPATWTWAEFDPAIGAADTFAPTMGREPINGGPSHWGAPTDPTLPLDPAITPGDFAGMTLSDAAGIYGSSAGGTGFDLADLGETDFDEVRYVRITSGAGGTPEVDAIAAVRAQCEAADADTDGNYDAADVLLVVGLIGAHDPAGEYGGDPSTLDFADLAQFLDLEETACP